MPTGLLVCLLATGIAGALHGFSNVYYYTNPLPPTTNFSALADIVSGMGHTYTEYSGPYWEHNTQKSCAILGGNWVHSHKDEGGNYFKLNKYWAAASGYTEAFVQIINGSGSGYAGVY